MTAPGLTRTGMGILMICWDIWIKKFNAAMKGSIGGLDFCEYSSANALISMISRSSSVSHISLAIRMFFSRSVKPLMYSVRSPSLNERSIGVGTSDGLFGDMNELFDPAYSPNDELEFRFPGIEMGSTDGLILDDDESWKPYNNVLI